MTEDLNRVLIDFSMKLWGACDDHDNVLVSPLSVALALGIKPLLDMFETACNVAGDNIGTYVIGKRMGMTEPERTSAGRTVP